MARIHDQLKARWVDTVRKPGDYHDGGGLYLQVTPSLAKSWILRFMLHGKARSMGLGSAHDVPLKDAREKARTYRRQVKEEGIDPVAVRKAKTAQALLDAAKALTFAECAAQCIASHRKGWKNAKHAAQWTNTLETYAFPTIGKLPVAAVDTGLVMKCIEPHWSGKTETAYRVRGRIESVLDWAKARGYRAGENPARWRGHLDELLPKPSKVRAVVHHPALPYVKLPAFMGTLRQQEGIAARALEFTILTAARTGETIGAQPAEFDLDAKIWTIPGKRMKSKREHRVPLAPRAAAVIRQMIDAQAGAYVFPGGRKGKPLSTGAMTALLKRMGRTDITVHGMRSTFRDWTAEQAHFPREVAEAALAHVVSDQTEAAYRRGDMLEKRRLLMEAWASYCAVEKAAAKVLPMRKRRA